MSTYERRSFNAIQPKRGPVQKRRKSGRRRGDSPYRPYLEYMHTLPCLVAGMRADSPCIGWRTVHHLRHIRHEDGTIERTGKIDLRTLTLCQGHHQIGPHAVHKLTADNGRAWELFFGVDPEAEVRRYNERYEQQSEGPECNCRLSGDRADASDCPAHGVSRAPAVPLVMEGSDENASCPF
jgi:hypothetical protein